MDDPAHLSPSLRLINSGIMDKRFEWQQQILDMNASGIYNKMIMLVDDHDNKPLAGKSLLCEYMEHMGYALEIPVSNSKNDIMKFCWDNEKKNCYVVDVPQTFTMKEGFFDAMKSLKDGLIWNKHKKLRIDTPNIVVFVHCNTRRARGCGVGWEVLRIKNQYLYNHADGDVMAWDKETLSWTEREQESEKRKLCCEDYNAKETEDVEPIQRELKRANI